MIIKTKKFQKKINKWLKNGPNGDWVNFFYIFFVFISILYAILFHSAGRVIQKEPILSSAASQVNVSLQTNIDKLVSGYPIEKMVPFISRRDEKTAAYLVAIAKKESNWGKYSPKKKGRECYNYWGYRGKENPTSSGYSCFDSPRHAVKVVGGRIREMINQDLDTPKKMAVWKCGYDCSWDKPQNVQKWIEDVDYYYRRVGNY